MLAERCVCVFSQGCGGYRSGGRGRSHAPVSLCVNLLLNAALKRTVILAAENLLLVSTLDNWLAYMPIHLSGILSLFVFYWLLTSGSDYSLLTLPESHDMSRVFSLLKSLFPDLMCIVAIWNRDL